MTLATLHGLHRPLGSTGLTVSPLGLGTVKLGRDQGVKYPNGFSIPDDAAARALLHQARELGINLLDTAPAYGISEERLGPLLRGQRQDWVIVSKVGEEFINGASLFDFSPAHTRLSVERSLKRLETEHIELLLVHSDGNDLAILHDSGVYATLAELKREGKIGAFGLRVVRRDREAELQSLLAAPEAFIASGHRFKGGGAATVARVELNGQPLLVKRYNIKNVAHWCKRFWRPSRAWHSWREGHRLSLLGIATPQPLAVLERRWCWLRGPALLITEYLPGHDIIARFRPYLDLSSGLEGPPEAELQALDGLFAALLRERISHGDLKGYNVFWDNGRWSLIDLDAMRQHHSDRSFARAYERDRARFLRNWPADSRLFKLLDQRLPQVPGTCPERG